jgi:hypothetical protein
MGWTATVNGRPAPITTVDTVYQQIKVPRGTSTVEFSFLPPHERLAVFVGFAALLVLMAAALNERVELLSLFRWGQKRTGEVRRTGRRRASIRPVQDDSATISKVVIPRSPRRRRWSNSGPTYEADNEHEGRD